MTSKLPNYLRTYRKGIGLTQSEVAFLLGCRSGAKVSHYEHFSREPNLETAFAYETIFRVPSREMFAGRFHGIERRTLRRVRALILRLTKAAPNALGRRKKEFLEEVSLGLRKEPHEPA